LKKEGRGRRKRREEEGQLLAQLRRKKGWVGWRCGEERASERLKEGAKQRAR